MRSLLLTWRITLLFVLGLGSISCGGLKSGQSGESGSPKAEMTFPILNPKVAVSPIRTLENAKNQTVHLEGKVGRQVPFLGSRAYELQDATGSIWVVTASKVPAAGETVLIRAVVRYQQINQAGRATSELYVEEQAQLTSTALQTRLPRS